MKIRIACLFALICLLHINGTAQLRILTIGDSTMADYDEVKNSEEKEKRGWAQMLPYFLTEDVKLDNAARNGRSSKSFYFEFWGNLRETLKQGDYVVIQFGHNDEKNYGKDTSEDDPKERGTAPWSQYRKYLKKYIIESRERGAIPILATPVVRRMFNEDGKTLSYVGLHNLVELSEVKNDSVMNYVLAMKSVAREMNVPLVDMTSLTKNLIEGLGPDKSKEVIYCHEDNTHLKAIGGLLFAQLFAQDMVNQELLTKYIRFPKDVAVTPDELNFGSQLVSIPSVKAISICAVNSLQQSNIQMSVSPPFEVSLRPNSDYTNNIVFNPMPENFYQPIYVRFISQEAVSYNGAIQLLVNGVSKTIELRGEGIAANKEKMVEASYTPSKSETIVQTKGAVSVSSILKGLKFKDKMLVPADEKWVGQEIDINSSRYIELTVSAKEDIYLNYISFDLKAIGSDKMQFTALGSMDADFVKTESYSVMENISNKEIKSYSFNTMINLQKGKTYSFRIYPWDKSGGNNKYILLENIIIKGLEVR